MVMEEDYGTGECGSCINFVRTRKEQFGKIKRWRGKCKSSGALVSSRNIVPCESFKDRDEFEREKIEGKSW